MGSRIGDNVIVGANSVVCGKLEPNSVYAGCPAKKVSSLDSFFKKNQERFEKSAYFYIKRFSEINKRLPNLNELHVYTILFKGGSIASAFNKPKYLVDNINKTASNKKYDSVSEFLLFNDPKYFQIYRQEKE